MEGRFIIGVNVKDVLHSVLTIVLENNVPCTYHSLLTRNFSLCENGCLEDRSLKLKLDGSWVFQFFEEYPYALQGMKAILTLDFSSSCMWRNFGERKSSLNWKLFIFSFHAVSIIVYCLDQDLHEMGSESTHVYMSCSQHAAHIFPIYCMYWDQLTDMLIEICPHDQLSDTLCPTSAHIC